MTRRALALLLLAAAALAAAGCGSRGTVREADLVVRDEARTTADPAAGSPADRSASESVRLQVVTHGQASSVFWGVVRNGIDAAARQVDAQVTYRAPDVFSIGKMRELILEAIHERPDGLIVTIPSPELDGAILEAKKAGIPVVSINSGSDLFEKVGALAHLGSDEARAGYEAGRRLLAAGVRHAVCLNLEKGNAALDVRCSEFGRALRAGGATSRTLEVNFDDARASERLLTGVFRSERVDGALALSSSGAEAAMAALRNVRRLGKVKLGSFDMSPKVLAAIRAGDLEFTVDQQPYLQGYLAIVFLAEYKRYGIFPSEGRLIPTGPHFVTKDDAQQAEELSARGIR